MAPINKLKAPFDLEIGCGAGDFAIQWARQTKNPMIAIEKTASRFKKFEKKYQSLARPGNLWPIQANAVWWLAHYGKKNSFERIFLLYPNPYPKKRQANKRWINSPFMPFLLDLLIKGGELELRTNKKSYYEEFKEKIKIFPFMRLKEDKAFSLAALAGADTGKGGSEGKSKGAGRGAGEDKGKAKNWRLSPALAGAAKPPKKPAGAARLSPALRGRRA